MDNLIRPIWYDYVAALGYELPEGMNDIAINRTGNKRFSDLLVSSQTESLLKRLGSLTWLQSYWTLSSMVQKLLADSPQFLDHVPGADDSSYPLGSIVLTDDIDASTRTFYRCYDNTPEASVWVAIDNGSAVNPVDLSQLLEKETISLSSNQPATLDGTTFVMQVAGESTSSSRGRGIQLPLLSTPASPVR